jgi:hypothetical protein
MLLFNNGTNVVDAVTHMSSLTLTTALAIAQGGTGATTADTALDNLGGTTVGKGVFKAATAAAAQQAMDTEVGVDVQAYDADLTALGGLAKTDGNIIVGNGTTWVAESGATARTSLGAASSGANSDITSITGLTTALTVAQGGTGATTLTANNVVLGNGTSAPNFVAPSTSGNILTSNGTTWTSTAPAGGGVTSLNGQTGAVVTTDYDAIGSVGQYIYAATGTASLNTTLYLNAAATIAGSSFRSDIGTSGQYTGTTPVAYYRLTNTTYNGGGTALSGTWRVMQRSAWFKNDNLGGGNYACSWNQVLVMRIS